MSSSLVSSASLLLRLFTLTTMVAPLRALSTSTTVTLPPPHDSVIPSGGDFHIPAHKMLYEVMSGGQSKGYQGPAQPTLVVGAGLPRTGTASLRKALTMLGMNCYHMLVAHETAGHLDMWRQHLTHMYNVSIDDVMDELANAGMNATIDAPAAFHYQQQLERYPDAKVILTERSEEDQATAWAGSVSNTILRIPLISHEIPWKWMGFSVRYGEFQEAMYDRVGLPHRPKDHHRLPAFYEKWNAEVKQTVPSENLLVFRAKEGWEPLCEFLAPLSDIIAGNCQIILASGIPYPYQNDRSKIQGAANVFFTISDICKAIPTLLAGVLVMILLRRSQVVCHLTGRRERTGQRQD